MTTYASLLAPMAAAAHEVGALLTKSPQRAAAQPVTPPVIPPVPSATPPVIPSVTQPADTMDELATAYLAVEGPAVAVMRRHLDALLPGVPWAEELHGERSLGSGADAGLPAVGDAWMVDVIDGAVQYMQGLPQFCVSLALVRDGEPVAAALHAPLLGETYLAAAGHGATRNGEPIAPSQRTRLEAALVGTSHPPFIAEQPTAAAAAGRSLAAVLPAVSAVRNLGPTSWQIADTAAGRLDAFWEYGRDDANLLPGALVAREAGAVVTDAEGRPWRTGAAGFLVAPHGLHGALLGLLKP
ncbi:inositol monophosphatase family protein [Streptomyces rimosus]|uniref:inositol monophosphatase family protein n=1 Tax=Streptomyces rimosus TaxID=1927 RepID=UPI0004C48A03|nr:inositol monophosphatase family protein [Streptomyces rimosus]